MTDRINWNAYVLFHFSDLSCDMSLWHIYSEI